MNEHGCFSGGSYSELSNDCETVNFRGIAYKCFFTKDQVKGTRLVRLTNYLMLLVNFWQISHLTGGLFNFLVSQALNEHGLDLLWIIMVVAQTLSALVSFPEKLLNILRNMKTILINTEETVRNRFEESRKID